MVPDQCIPAAQYLRMSTEYQRYSMENQSSAIQRYAESRGFAIVRTYFDAARSGISLKRRAGLKQLLEDVMSGASVYKVILVYDVSRWGRFQDIDESAHYEFLCKSVGVPVHYCAESFANDGALPNLVMKVLKRTMAAEYSRELCSKVLAGQKRLARLGFKQGGIPGYGLRRMLVSPDRQPKQQLAGGERKSIATDRVILVPGPSHEVNVVREVYRMLIEEKLSVCAIAHQLNRRGIQYQGSSNWNHGAVNSVLTHTKYAGAHVFGRTSSRLSTGCVRSPQSEWIIYPDAFAPIIDRHTFAKAQQILLNRTANKSNDEILRSLKELFAREGRLSFKLIKESGAVPSPSAYRTRFGGLRRAYELVGYGQTKQFDFIDQRHRTQALREGLITTIGAMFAGDVSIVRHGGGRRTKLLLRDALTVSVLVSRSVRVWKDSVRWLIDPVQDECRYVTLLAKMDEANGCFKAFHLLPNIDRATRFHIQENDSWLNRGLRLNDLSQFCAAALAVASRH
jgi:DNA invertase Pin-like site-specific DNA recombinase